MLINAIIKIDRSTASRHLQAIRDIVWDCDSFHYLGLRNQASQQVHVWAIDNNLSQLNRETILKELEQICNS